MEGLTKKNFEFILVRNPRYLVIYKDNEGNEFDAYVEDADIIDQVKNRENPKVGDLEELKTIIKK